MEYNIILGTIISAALIGLAWVSGVQYGIRISKPNRSVDLDNLLQLSRLRAIGNTFNK
jgi:hypothetical protein